MFFLEPLLDRLLCDFMVILCQKDRFWSPRAPQLDPKSTKNAPFSHKERKRRGTPNDPCALGTTWRPKGSQDASKHPQRSIFTDFIDFGLILEPFSMDFGRIFTTFWIEFLIVFVVILCCFFESIFDPTILAPHGRTTNTSDKSFSRQGGMRAQRFELKRGHVRIKQQKNNNNKKTPKRKLNHTNDTHVKTQKNNKT